MQNIKSIGIIPARYASSRFPGKPLVEILGKSMIQRVWERAQMATQLDEVFIATDDERIQQHCLQFGAKVVLTNPNHQSGTDRCAEVLHKLKEEGLDIKYIINIQGDEPLIDPDQIDQLLQRLKRENDEALASLYRLISPSEASNPNVVKVVLNRRQEALYFSRSVIPYPRNKEVKSYKKHIGMYAYTASVLQAISQLTPSELEKFESLEQLRWLEEGYTLHMIETQVETLGVDSPEDVQKIISQLQKS